MPEAQDTDEQLPDRFGITLTGEALDNARRVADIGGISVSEAVRRSLAVLRFLSDEQERGSALKLQSPSGELERIHLVYT